MAKKRRIFDPEPQQKVKNFQQQSRVVIGGLGRLPVVQVTRQAIINDDRPIIPDLQINQEVYNKAIEAWNKTHPT